MMVWQIKNHVDPACPVKFLSSEILAVPALWNEFDFIFHRGGIRSLFLRGVDHFTGTEGLFNRG